MVISKRLKVSIDKASFRKECMKKLKKASRGSKRYNTHQVVKSLENVLLSLNPQSVLFYMPLPFEVDVRALLNKNRKIRKCYVPFMVEESFKMVRYRLPLKRGNFGVYEPKDSLLTIKNVDVAIVPVVGVDADARRVGFGKGMYDRFFAQLKTKPITIFVQLDACVCKEKITDYYDVQADLYITPKTINYKSRKKRYVKSDSLRRGHSHRQWSSRIFDL